MSLHGLNHMRVLSALCLLLLSQVLVSVELDISVKEYFRREVIFYRNRETIIDQTYRRDHVEPYSTLSTSAYRFQLPHFFGDEVWYMTLPISNASYDTLPFVVPIVGQSWSYTSPALASTNGSCYTILEARNPGNRPGTFRVTASGERLATNAFLQTINSTNTTAQLQWTIRITPTRSVLLPIFSTNMIRINSINSIQLWDN